MAAGDHIIVDVVLPWRPIQVASCALYAKYATRVESLESIPFHIEKVSPLVLLCRPVASYGQCLHYTKSRHTVYKVT